MKLVIDISDEEYKTLSKMSEKEKVNELSYYERVIANGIPVSNEGDLISREALKKYKFTTQVANGVEIGDVDVVPVASIDNAPAVKIDTNDIEYKAYCKGLEDGKKIARSPDEVIIAHERIAYERGVADGYAEALEEIKDKERPQGEWIGSDKVVTYGNLAVSGCWHCNKCGALRGVDANFCGNCGAAMKEGEKE